mgnify:CR=1 FL=1
MKGLKDFLYNKNDILLAIAILVVAALLIYWRLNVIMDYPKEVARQTSTSNTTEQSAVADDNSSTSDSTKAGSSDSSSASGSVFSGGVLTKDVTVTVASGSATGAVNSLVEAGLFKSYDDFVSTCKKAGCSADNIKAATFTFDKGSTKADIAKKVTE